jgi:hypothetical protein
MNDDSELDRSFQIVYSILKFVGATGGLVMYHHERIPSKFNDREDISEGPHFHCIVDSTIDTERVLCVKEQTAFIVIGFGRPDSLSQHLSYVLSHLGIPREVIPGWKQCTVDPLSLNPALDGIVPTRLHTIRWFGVWCGLKGHPETGRFCPICNHSVDLDRWGRVIWLPLDRPPPDDEWIDGTEMDWVVRHGQCKWE